MSLRSSTRLTTSPASGVWRRRGRCDGGRWRRENDVEGGGGFENDEGEGGMIVSYGSDADIAEAAVQIAPRLLRPRQIGPGSWEAEGYN